jgi:amino acid transporter
MKKNTVLIIVTVLLLALPVIVFAQQIIPNNDTTLPGNPNSTFTSVLSFYIRVILGIFGLLSVAFLIYGGFQYMTAAGNEERAENGKKTIQNAIIGLVIVILSFVIVTVVVNALLPQGRGV